MSFFEQVSGSTLYAGATGGADAGWLGYLLPDGATPPGPGIELQPALAQLGGSFLFSATAPDLGTTTALNGFIGAVNLVIARSPASRAFLWLTDPLDVTADTAPLMGLSAAGDQVSNRLTAPIVETLSLAVSAGAPLVLDGETLQIGGAGSILFTGGLAPGSGAATQVASGTLPLSGEWRGCIRFDIALQRAYLNASLDWGFQFLIPSDDPVRTSIGEWLPLAAGFLPNAGDLLGFSASFDPSDPYNRRAPVADRSVLAFTGTNQGGTATVLVSWYATTFGAQVTLVPVAGPLDTEPRAARFLFNPGPPDGQGNHDLQLAPEGDFVLSLAGAQAGQSYDLLCGLQGTEYVSFQPRVEGSYDGDRLRFTARQPAYAPRYPFTSSSPVGPPVDLQAPLLDPTYTTAWATVARAPDTAGGIPYVAQPKGAALYGRDPLINAGATTLFGALDPAVVLGDAAFPVVPYGGAAPLDGVVGFDAATMEDFERQVVGPTRRQRIGASAQGTAATGDLALGLPRKSAGDGDDAAAGAPYNTTTPTGLLVTVDADGQWSKVLLGQNLNPTPRQLYFCQPDAELQQAFQTSDLFLVVANAEHLGALSGSGSGDCGSGAAFYNRMNVEGWEFEADVGQSNQYGDYASVMIVKGRHGALWDPTSDATRQASLVSNPDQWTQRDTFASPSDLVANPNAPPAQVPGTPNPDELTALSFWLQTYFQDAVDQDEADYFGNFNRIAADPGWTGILVLRMKIASVPEDLVGIKAGIAAPDRFYAHHLGIQISQVANDPDAPQIELRDTSSMFGLIYYEDPDYVAPAPGAAVQPVPPLAGNDYEFRVLTLKALFENTAVQRFQSYAQLTLGQLFGMPVTQMGAGGNPYATLVLRGSYQDNNGKPVYALGTTATSTFYFANNVFNKIELDGAQMSTRDGGATSGTVVSWFGLSGFLDFAVVQARPPASSDGSAASGGAPASADADLGFDIFSFGSDPGEDQLRRGLSFSNLGVRMSFPTADPTQAAFVFVTDEMRFDVGTSTARAQSLFVNFALGLQGLAVGTAESTPEAMGYLTVITDATLSGVDGGPWYGLRYQLDMGTPGNLAGTVGLTSGLLTAWSPTGGGGTAYAALLGIQLPGTGGGARLISLQNVLRLSIGQLVLTYDRSKSSFLLMMTEIALKFMGLLKIPPSGSTLFYLFGNPKSGGKASGLGWYAMYRQDSATGALRPASDEQPALPRS